MGKNDALEPLVSGGYYIKARKIQESKIAHAAPHIREVWDYLIMKANHSDNAVCLRGQHVTNCKQIREDLHWYVGWRKEYYKISACENSMKWLKKADMITTRRTVRGTLITVINYSLYQDPVSYESRKENFTKAPLMPDSCRPINKNEKNKKNKKNKKESVVEPETSSALSVEDLVQAWNSLAPDVKKCIKITNDRRKITNAMIRAVEKHLDTQDREKIVSHFRQLMAQVKESNFCKGKNDRGWKAHFDWFIRPDTQWRILEGQYDGTPQLKTLRRTTNHQQMINDFADNQEDE